MEQTKYIKVITYCEKTNIDSAFVTTLEEYGLIKTTVLKSEVCITEDDTTEIERMFRLHKELGVNIEGIDVINHLVKRLKKVESELKSTRKTLSLYE
ncbi:hypothetical protein INR76_11545 [Marixanthomonas sp. SCSIO 43207]|uniref:chaperone modulator CbpM n=1 Tax=Marixanthomonas sp. SCSIO 43207 TaxID=2779360 RepID=UPI001CA99C86|nr:chaperone modulator CbpM [Marixanthomonas sp. SCSIO 43207]UAB80737.1 hypothetical protein INR76_11545 [Marixanthomonas sp. SCSIO 43207]